jgi:hypothetical protein
MEEHGKKIRQNGAPTTFIDALPLPTAIIPTLKARGLQVCFVNS